MLNFLREIDKKYKNKKILIVSHGDPLWLFWGALKGLTNQEFLDEMFVKKNYIKAGELRKLSLR
jgi:isoleucyl-tRNA synthetase